MSSGVLAVPRGLTLPSDRRVSASGRDDPSGSTRLPVRFWRVARMAAELVVVLIRAVTASWRPARVMCPRFAQRSAQRTLDALRVNLCVDGARPVTDGPVLVIANHVSWLDVYALNAVMQARFLAKREVRSWPLIGFIADRSGTFFIVRRSVRDAARVKNRIAAELAAGHRVVVFPEGTTTDGTRIGRFYAAMLQAAVDAGAVVQPVAIRYSDRAGRLQPAAAFVDDMTFVESLGRVLRQPLINVELVFGAPIPAGGGNRRELTMVARDRIARMLRMSAA